jgi:hypothetical protein
MRGRGAVRADTIDLNHLFWTGVRYEVPLFQRPYVWTREEQWEPLWEDVSTIAERLLNERAKATPEEREQGIPERNTPPHFLGAVVLDQMLAPPGQIERRHIIDGQQRLTTLQLLLAAARDVASDTGSDEAQRFSKLAENDAVLCRVEDDRFKVWPTNADRAAFKLTMLEVAPLADAAISSRILEANAFFKQAVAEWVSQDGGVASPAERLGALRVVLWSHVKLVSINLELGDDAQVIFESLNARGTPLLASDLIKNHLFQRAAKQHADVEAVYGTYWKPLEAEYWQKELRQGRLKRPRIDVFFFHWLTMRSNHEVLVSRLFETFKETIASDEPIESTLDDIGVHSRIFQSFEAFPRNTPEELFFYRLNITQTATATPLLLYVFSLTPAVLSLEDRRHVLASIESWLIRRMLCRLTTKNYNILFSQLLSKVRTRPSAAAEDVSAFLLKQQGESQLWPTDDDVRTAVLSLPVYKLLGAGRLRMTLEALESSLRAPGYAEEVGPPRDLSIEHVIPQSWTESAWPLTEKGDEQLARLHRSQMIHTLGNLTLVTQPLNSKQSNEGWSKKVMTLAEHTVLKLNRDILDDYSAKWDEDVIRARGAALAEQAIAVWPRPADTRTTTEPLGGKDEPRNETSVAPINSGMLRADVKAFLNARITREEDRALVESFLGRILALPDTSADVGRSNQTKDGWAYSVNVRRGDRGGAFMYVYANRKVLFRLTDAEAQDLEPVEFAKGSKGEYRVRASIATEQGRLAATELAKRAYEKALL